MQTSVATFMLDNLNRPQGCPENDPTVHFDFPSGDSSILAKCSLQAAKEFRLAIGSFSEPTQRLCMTFWSFTECHADLKLPLASKYLLGRSQALFNDFISKHCMAINDEDGMDMAEEAAPVCEQPLMIGPCKAAFQQFFYNSTSQMCELFIYGGCDGNDNRFDNITECQEKCVKDEMSDGECNLSKASICLSTHLLKLFTKLFMPFSHQSVICSGYDEVKECVRESMMGCSSSAKLHHVRALELYESVYQWACPLIRPEIPNIHSCLPHIAKSSLQYFSVILANTGSYNINETCKELSYALSVVHATTLNCSESQKDEIGDFLSDLRPLIGDMCPAITNVVHCNGNSSYLVEDPGEKNLSCSTLPVSCDTHDWVQCLPSTWNETTICGATQMATCISNFIRGCHDSDIAVVYEEFTAFLSQTFTLGIVKPCDVGVIWPSTFDPERGAGNCTQQFKEDLEEKYLLSLNLDRSILCSLFTDLMECMDEVSSTQPLVSQRLAQVLGSKLNSQLSELCQAAEVSPCEVGDPLKDENGDEYFCGRGSSGFCPEGSHCVISPTDSYAVCCAKGKNSTEKDCGSAPADLVFLVDESSSIGSSNFQIQKQFVIDLLHNSVIATNIETGIMRVALVTFSRNPTKRFGLNTYNTTADMSALINSIPYDKSGTEIEKGLRYVREVTLSAAEGARSEAPKIVILLTDGSSSDNSETEANLLRDMDVTLLVIGIGNVDMDQLKAIAANDKFLFTVADFSELSGIAEQFVASIPCPEEPLTCHLSEAVHCYNGQARSLLSGLYPVRARSTVCSTTQRYADCVTNMTVTCSSEKHQKFLQVSDWTQKLVSAQGICKQPEDITPKYCHPEEAAPCLATMSKVIARYQHTPTRTAICSQILTTEMCVLKSIKDCDEGKRSSVLQAYQDMTTLAHLACMAPQIPKPMPPDCKQEGHMCNDIEALNCLVSAHTSLVAAKRNRETACNSLVVAKNCVKRQIAGCEAGEKATIHRMYEKLVGRRGHMCPEIYCERCAALQCVEDLTAMLRKGGKEMCNMIDSTKRCVKKRAKHCSHDERKKIYAKLDYVVMMTTSQCEKVAMHCITAFKSASLQILQHNQPTKSTDSSSMGSQSNSASQSNQSNVSNESQSDAGEESQSNSSSDGGTSTETSAGSSGMDSESGSQADSGSASRSNSGSSSKWDVSAGSQQETAEEDEILCDDQLGSDFVLDEAWSIDLDMCYIGGTSSGESGSKSEYSCEEPDKSSARSSSSHESLSAQASESTSTSGESQSASGQSSRSASTNGESQSASGQSSGSASTSGESQSASGQSSGSASTSGESSGNASTSGESQSASGQSSGSASTSGESQSASGQSSGSASTSGESQSASGQSSGSASTSEESSGSASTSWESQSTSGQSSGSGETKVCMSRLAWMCKKASMSWECAQKAMLILPEDRQRVLRQALTGVYASIQYKCAASKLQCFSCNKEDSNDACNTRSVETCAANKQACETVVDFGAKVITKGCVNPSSCRTQCTGNSKKCSYCCHDNLCNQPWDSVITESRKCVGVSAVKCAFSLVKAVAHTEELSCSEVETSLECMKKNTIKCISSQYMSIKEQVPHLESSALLTKCRMRQLHCHCGLCGSLALGISIQNNFHTDETVCLHLMDTIQGTSLATMEQSCSFTDFQASFLSLNLAWSVIGDTCHLIPKMNDTSTRDNVTSAESGPSSVESPTSGEITANASSEAGTSSEESSSSREIICDPKAAIECFDNDMARKEVIMALMYGFDRVCRLKDMWMNCVKENVETCSADKYTDIWDQVMYKTSWVRGHCQRITMDTPDKCDIDQAMQCLTTLGKMSSATVMCANKNLTFDCVAKHTASCLSVQRAPLDFVMGELKFSMESVCDISMDVDDNDIYHDLADCVVGFGHRVHRSMKVIGSNSTTLICEAAILLQSCLYDEKLPPLAKIYTKHMAEIATSFIKHICSSDDMEKPLYCHSCRGREDRDCQSSTDLTICDPLSERCSSMLHTREDGTQLYIKGCMAKDQCETVCPTSTNCSYCCQTDFCNAAVLPDVTVTTPPPNIVTEQAACGYSVADIVILLDESSSITKQNFFIMANFVNNIITQLNIGEDSIRLGLATFSSQGHLGFSLDSYYDRDPMIGFVTQLAEQYGDKSGTNVAAGLDLVHSQIFGGNGNRPDVQDVILLLTDGEFQSGYESAVNAVQQANISVLVVGIGDGVLQAQLRDVASDPRYVFTVEDFSVLDTIVGDFVQTIPCPPEPPSCTLHQAATCVSGPLVRLLVTPFTPLQYRHTLCSDLEIVQGCLSTSLMNCPISNTNNMYKMTTWMKNTLSPMCIEQIPPVRDVCNITTAEMCLQPLMHLLSNKVLASDVCQTLDASLTCLTEVTKGNCFRDVVVSVSQTLQIVRGIIGDTCSTELSENLCVMANPVILRQSCDQNEVDNCVEMFKDFVDGYSLFNTEEEACKEYTIVQTCLEDKSALCDPSVRLTANTTVMDKFAELSLSGECAASTRVCPLPGQCSIKNAFELAVNALRTSPSCRSGNTLMQSISNEIYDCNSIQRYSSETDFKSLLSECPPISLLIPAANDIFVPLTECVRDFNTAITKALDNYFAGIRDFCPAVRGISACFQSFYDTLEEIPAGFLSSGLLNVNHQVFKEFLDKSCNGSEIVICEDFTKTIECPEGEVIDIQEAFYGREDRITCSLPNKPLTDTACSSPVALDRYKEICSNKTTCNVTASNSVTGDPCVNTYKYARITYSCVAASPDVTTETDDCLQKDVVRCMGSYLSNAMFIGLFRNHDREELCRSSLSLDTCIYDGMRNCSTRLQNQYKHLYDIGSSVISYSGVCEEADGENEEEDRISCSPHQAWECIARLGMDLSYYETSRDRGDICRLAKHSTDCYHHYLYDCTDPINTAMSITMNNVIHYALRMCHENYMEPKDTVYPSPPPICVDPLEMTGYRCNHVKALQSLSNLFEEIFNPYGSQQRLCV
ncbi:uncharacterized protein LOC132551440 [Ylistrum balloti]|uniref:uncharacterized protein LOC132551440 n=1 Tax=Ylistrum balloti TaxID=509963 RepID=UPI002905AB84|nr:uncharacterized protein LOC132551440 [Ylistrum balloti]